MTVFDQNFVFRQYLEDEYGHLGDLILTPPPAASDKRALVNLLVRMHDIYISSPNNTQPNFCHTQGAMLKKHSTVFLCLKQHQFRQMVLQMSKSKILCH